MKKNLRIIYLSNFLYSIPAALVAYIHSSFIASFVGEKLVSLVYVLSSIGSVLILLVIPQIFRKIGGFKTLLVVTFLETCSFFLLTLAKSPSFAILAFILSIAFNTSIIFSLDEILKIFSREKKTGAIRGNYIGISNLAWILAEFLVGFALGAVFYANIYRASAILMFIFFLFTLLVLRKIPDPDYDKTGVVKYIKKFFQDEHLARAFGIVFLLQIFYCWMIIYTPIYLHLHLGFSLKEIGIIFMIMLLPFAFIPFKIGKYADKVGERKMLMVGFIITSLSTFLLFFTDKHILSLWAGLLFLTRVGASTIETMGDVYFFKHIHPENEEYIGVYRNTSPLAYIVGPLISFIVLIFFPLKFIFLILGTIMLFGVYLSSRIKRSDI